MMKCALRGIAEWFALAALLFLVVLANERPAMAYTDPGTGMMLVQLLSSMAVASLFYFARVRHWVAGLFKRKKEPSTTPNDNA